MVDKIGSGYETRRRMLEEDRTRELDKIEQNYKEQVEKAQEAREKILKDLYQSQEENIEERRGNVEQRIADVKAATDAKIREFEADATRMTEEAKRQYQHKANQLAGHAKELEAQRKFMLKQHSDSMDKIRKDHVQRHSDSQLKMQAEAAKVRNNQIHEINRLKAAGEEEVREVQYNYKDQKDRTLAEGQRALRDLEFQKNQNQAHVEDEILKQNRFKNTQVENIRQTQKNQEVKLEQDFDNRMWNMRHAEERAITRAHHQGRQKTEEVKDIYARQITDTTKTSEKKLKETELNTQKQMQAMENDAELRKHLKKREYEFQEQNVYSRRERLLQGQQKYNVTLQEKLQEQKIKHEQDLKQKHVSTLTKKAAEIQETIDHLDKTGKKQINETIRRHSDTLADHGIRSQDSFYRVHNFDASVHDYGNEYVVHVHVPEHEQDNVRLTLQKGALSLSGTRRFEGKMKLPTGESASTNSYQSYTESFPVRGKLEMRQMSRDYADGRLTFRIPKS